MKSALHRRSPRQTGHPRRFAVLAMACLAAAGSAQAFEVDTGDSDLKILWDNTFKYSAGFRMKSASSSIVGGPNYDTSSANYFPNTDDGDRNFKKGLVSNRLDLLSELDVHYGDVGFRLSGAAWADSVYLNGKTDNQSPATYNPISVDNEHFTEATKKLHGGKAEVLDAFVFGRVDLAGMPTSVRLGKLTQLYGESFMMGANGIAAAQAPIDVVKAATVPNAQFKEFMMPVNQLSVQTQVSPDLSLGGYLMLDWKSDRLPGSGSYFGFMDALATGGERLIVSHADGVGNIYFAREKDLTPSKTNQFGLQMKLHVGEVDYGLYAVQWNDHGPSGLYLHPYDTPSASANGLAVGSYQWVFHQGIKAVGASFTTTLESVNLAGEVSYRWNTPLDSDAQTDTVSADNKSHPLYAVGRSAHAQVSWIASLGDSFISREADFVGELAWNRRLAITANAAALNPNATRDAANVRMVYEPKYRQVFPGVDLSVPVGLGWGLKGNSSVVGAFLGQKTGDLSVGLNGSYLDVWRFGLNYTHYLGEAAPFIEYGHRTFKQYYADRDYLSFNLRRTF